MLHNFDINSYLQERKKIIDSALDEYLPSEDTYPQLIHKSMRYSVFAGGKRLRPILVMAVLDIFNKNLSQSIPAACAVEMVHTYSLIHDDLPSMDNDDYRRGKLTNHKVFGEGIAVLAGDALLTIAFETLAKVNTGDPEVNIKIIKEIAGALGTDGMIGGQVVDLESEGKKINKRTLNYIHTRKTGALIRASVRVGAIISGASETELEALTGYSEALGLAFQITDDILDIEGEEAKLGKATRKDAVQKKATYPGIFGLEEAKKKSEDLYLEALKAVEIFQNRGDTLKYLAHFLVNRDY